MLHPQPLSTAAASPSACYFATQPVATFSLPARQWLPHGLLSSRLVCHRCVPHHHPRPRTLVPLPSGQVHGRLLRLWTERELVARRNLHGRHHLRRRHAAPRHRTRVCAGRQRQLAVVGTPSLGHDDRLPLCPTLAPLRTPHGRA